MDPILYMAVEEELHVSKLRFGQALTPVPPVPITVGKLGLMRRGPISLPSFGIVHTLPSRKTGEQVN